MALFIIADDSHRLGKMRGRGGYTEVIPPRRKPVRIEDVDHIYTGSRKAARISDFANEDSEDLSRRSHLKDKKLLNDITTKLVNTSYTEPIRVHRTGARRPPVVPLGRKPVYVAAATPRRVGIRPVPSLSHTYRASSVPPRYVEEEVVTPYNFYEVAMPRSYYAYRPPPVRSAPQFRGAYRSSSEPPLQRSSTLAVKNARRCLDRIERELGVDDGELYSSGYGPAPAPVAREVRARTSARGRVAGAAAGGLGGGVAVRRRPGSLPPSSSRNRINQAEIEREVEDYLEQPFLKKSLRSRAASLERTRVTPPSYVPIVVPRRSSVSGSLERMPGLDPYRPKQGSSSVGNNYGNNYGASSVGGGYGSAITPYTPARISKAPPPAIGGLPPKGNYYRTNSDNRNRIRYVVCYVKQNPYHFSRW